MSNIKMPWRYRFAIILKFFSSCPSRKAAVQNVTNIFASHIKSMNNSSLSLPMYIFQTPRQAVYGTRANSVMMATMKMSFQRGNKEFFLVGSMIKYYSQQFFFFSCPSEFSRSFIFSNRTSSLKCFRAQAIWLAIGSAKNGFNLFQQMSSRIIL